MQLLPDQQVSIRYQDGDISIRGLVSLSTGGYCFASMLDVVDKVQYHLWSQSEMQPTPAPTPTASPTATATMLPTPTHTLLPTPTPTPTHGWNYFFSDKQRKSKLWINTNIKAFRFTAPGFDSGVKFDPAMRVTSTPHGLSISIRYADGGISLRALARNGALDVCNAILQDLVAGAMYQLWDEAGIE